MRKIFKYPIEMSSEITLSLPIGSTIQCIKVNNNTPFIYAIVDENEKELEDNKFRCYVTGEELDEYHGEYYYFDTISLNSGTLIFHLYSKY